MKRTGISLLSMAAGLCLTVTANALAEGTNSDPYVSVAVARATLEKAMRQDASLYDSGRSGWDETWRTMDSTWEQVAHTLEQAIQREEAKEESRRDENLMHSVRQKREQRELDWNAFQKTRSEIKFSYEDSQRAYGRISEIFDGTAELERRWKDAGLELAVLERIYTTLAKRLDDLRAKVTKTLKDETAGQTRWEDALDEAKAVVK